MKKLLTTFLILLFATSIFAQKLNHGEIKQKHYFQEIPYQKIETWIMVPVTINGKVYKFIVDTGAPLAISDKLYKELNLQIIRQINTNDAAGENKKMRYVVLPEIDLQGITFLNTSGIVLHENSKWAECFEIDGIIGSNMLRNSIVQLDEQKNHIIITNDIKRVSLQNSECQKMKLSLGSNPYFKITLQKGAQKTVQNVLFDSGDGGNFFALSMHRLRDYVVDIIAESEGFEWGAHEVFKKQKHLLLNIPEFVVNRLSFNDVIVTTTQSDHSRIGVKFLQYGKTTLDYKKKRFYFEPFENINTDKLYELPWGIGFTMQNDKKVVGIVWDKALESQLNVGDEVLSMNGMDLQFMNYCELRQFKTPSTGDELIVELKDKETGEIKKVEIKRVQLNK
jgi:predicted aspartyl protease